MRTTIINSVITIILSSMSMGALAENLTAGNKATASLVASCQIQAQSISFGALVLPISAQSANSNMNVLCSKETPYKIDLTYGYSTNYWTFSGWNVFYASPNWYGYFREYDSSGKMIKEQRVTAVEPKAPTYNKLQETVGCQYLADGKCHSQASSTSSGTMATGNMYGAKGDNISYNIYIPEDSSKIWNIGQNAYLGTGTGLRQNIPVKAQLVPSGSTAYPTPDMYTDTVTATITY